jgi:S1-C subfamily serine protease
VLTKMGDRDLEGMEDFLDELRRHKAGDQVQVTLVRNGQQEQKTVTLAERPPG